MNRCVLRTLTLPKSPIIIHQTRHRQVRAEVLGESIEVHFLDGGEAVRHYDAGVLGRILVFIGCLGGVVGGGGGGGGLF